MHDLASRAADYAACMVGPTGPELIRDHLAEFSRLVRRRVVAATPDEAPFHRCGKLAAELGAADATGKHAARAEQFAEYGLSPGDALSAAALVPDMSVLAERTRAAWPFVRGGFARLVRPSLNAREAVHPVPPPEPGLGRGLPPDRALPKRAFRSSDGLWLLVGSDANRRAFVSRDEGSSFRVASSDRELVGACGGKEADRGFDLSSRTDGSLLVTSLGANREPSTVTAVLGEHTLLAVSCDDTALVLAAQRENKSSVELWSCAHERACVPLKVPNNRAFTPLTATSFDIARVASTTVLASERAGIVRVVSTRDDGRTWTPPLVAYDALDGSVSRTAPPTRLLAAGARLFLYGVTARPTDAYPLLVSDDQGASFRALPTAAKAIEAPASVARRR